MVQHIKHTLRCGLRHIQAKTELIRTGTKPASLRRTQTASGWHGGERKEEQDENRQTDDRLTDRDEQMNRQKRSKGTETERQIEKIKQKEKKSREREYKKRKHLV